MSIESDITEWALLRPGWQQDVLVGLAQGDVFDDAAIGVLADQLLDPKCTVATNAATSIVVASSAPRQVALLRVRNVQGVNALADGQNLTFAPTGMTVIYGNNGSGKSGYARLIKAMVSARHSAPILPDVYKESPQAPAAELDFEVGGAAGSQSFPGEAGKDLQHMRFYDVDCGDEYLTKSSTITYRPSALVLLDGLIQICDRLRAELASRIKKNAEQALQLDISPQTTAGAFMYSVTATTSDDQIDRATTLPPGSSEDLAVALQEVARLEGSSAEKEQIRLSSAAKDLDVLTRRLTGLNDSLSDKRVDDIHILHETAKNLRVAATVAATQSFDDEPLAGVGTEAWRALWNAAREYSTAEAYHEHEFPVTSEGARCILCHQVLDGQAGDRLRRFEQFMTDTTERDAKKAELDYQTALDALQKLEVASQATTTALATLRTHDGLLSNAVQTFLASLDDRKKVVLAHLREDGPKPQLLPTFDLSSKVLEVSRDLTTRASNTDVAQFQDQLEGAKKRRDELQASIRLHDARPKLKSESARLRARAVLERAKGYTDTNSITQKTTQLTRKYATSLILDNFTRETERLKLSKVTLEDLGGQKGQLNQRPALLGAKHRDASAQSVLSEGEKTALGLAGFFTEAEFDPSKSAIIFDDPVTSLDHVRRDHVASRLVRFAKERQVVVFTHDVSFVADLSAAAEPENVTISERSIERKGAMPGMCIEAFPWKAKDFKQRIADLRTDLQRIRKDRATLTESAYEEQVASWAGRLSETWERSVSTEILNQVFERGRSEVRPAKFRLFASITKQDDVDFQDGYAHTSKWARRHDKAPGTNYIAPDPDEMETELDRLVTWQKRIKSYL